MCLITSSKTPLISKLTIKCYKILIPIGGKLVTPYRDFVFPVGRVIVDTEVENIIKTIGGFNTIESGFFHSYLERYTAKIALSMMKRTFKDANLKIYNAEIPLNSEFYIGEYGDLCSKALKIIDECCD